VTIDGVRFLRQYGLQGVGGPIDVAAVTSSDGFQYLQRKECKDFLPETKLTWHVCSNGERSAPSVSTPPDITQMATYTVALSGR